MGKSKPAWKRPRRALREFHERHGHTALLQRVGLPPPTAHNTAEWLAASTLSTAQRTALDALADIFLRAIGDRHPVRASRVSGSTSRQTAAKSHVDLDLALLCPSAAAIDTLESLLGPELLAKVTWHRASYSDRWTESGTLSRRIFAELVHRSYPDLAVDITLFTTQDEFGVQGATLNQIRYNQHTTPGARDLTVALKAALDRCKVFAKNEFSMDAYCPGIMIELAALWAAERYKVTAVTPQALTRALHAFNTPNEQLRAVYRQKAFDFDTSAKPYRNVRFLAERLAFALKNA